MRSKWKEGEPMEKEQKEILTITELGRECKQRGIATLPI